MSSRYAHPTASGTKPGVRCSSSLPPLSRRQPAIVARLRSPRPASGPSALYARTRRHVGDFIEIVSNRGGDSSSCSAHGFRPPQVTHLARRPSPTDDDPAGNPLTATTPGGSPRSRTSRPPGSSAASPTRSIGPAIERSSRRPARPTSTATTRSIGSRSSATTAARRAAGAAARRASSSTDRRSRTHPRRRTRSPPGATIRLATGSPRRPTWARPATRTMPPIA